MSDLSKRSDIEEAREPLLGGAGSGSTGGGGSGGGSAAPSRGISPDRLEHVHAASTPGGAFRLTRRSTSGAPQHEGRDEPGEGEEQGGLVLKEAADGNKAEADMRELEVEVVAGAVAEAVAEAVQEAVQEAVHDAVQQAIEENVRFDVRATFHTLIAVTGVILFWRGVWNSWDLLFGTSTMASNLGSLLVGLAIMTVVRILNLPLVEGLPGG